MCMPQLPKKREWTEEEREKIAELTLGANDSLQQLGRTLQASSLNNINSLVNPAINESLRNFALTLEEPLYQMRKDMIASITEPFRQMNLNLGKMISEIAVVQLKSLDFTSLGRTYPFDAIDGDFEYADDDSSNEPIKETALAPQESYMPIPVTPGLPHSKTNKSIKRISGGNFAYKRKTLKGLSLNNREGQLLNIMHLNVDFYIDDVVMDKNLYTHDTLGRSTLIKLLKKKFKNNGLIADIRRQGSGYILIDIKTRYTN